MSMPVKTFSTFKELYDYYDIGIRKIFVSPHGYYEQIEGPTHTELTFYNLILSDVPSVWDDGRETVIRYQKKCKLTDKANGCFTESEMYLMDVSYRDVRYTRLFTYEDNEYTTVGKIHVDGVTITSNQLSYAKPEIFKMVEMFNNLQHSVKTKDFFNMLSL